MRAKRDPLKHYEAFAASVVAAGLRARECSWCHWRVEGGAFDVNFYPTRGTVHVNGMNSGTRTIWTIEAMIAVAIHGPEWNCVKRSKRKQNYRSAKRKLLRRDPRCHWCGLKLTAATATADHLIPLSKGGSNGGDNLVLACEPCNSGRKNEVGSRKKPNAGSRQL